MAVDIDELIRENVVIQEWIQQGMQRGIEQGILVGECSVLRRQAERRFGVLPAWAVARIEAASLDELDAWASRIFDARTIEELLG